MATKTIHQSSTDEGLETSRPARMYRNNRSRLKQSNGSFFKASKSARLSKRLDGNQSVGVFSKSRLEAPLAEIEENLASQLLQISTSPRPGSSKSLPTALTSQSTITPPQAQNLRRADPQNMQGFPTINYNKLRQRARPYPRYEVDRLLNCARNFLSRESANSEIDFGRKLSEIGDFLEDVAKQQRPCDVDTYDEVCQMVVIHRKRIEAFAFSPTKRMDHVRSTTQIRRYQPDNKTPSIDHRTEEGPRKKDYAPFTAIFGSTDYNEFLRKLRKSNAYVTADLAAAELFAYSGNVDLPATTTEVNDHLELARERGEQRRQIQESLRVFSSADEQVKACTITSRLSALPLANLPPAHDLRLTKSLSQSSRSTISDAFLFSKLSADYKRGQDLLRFVAEQDSRFNLNRQSQPLTSSNFLASPFVAQHGLDKALPSIARLLFQLVTGRRGTWSCRAEFLELVPNLSPESSVPPSVVYLFDLLLDCDRWSNQTKCEFLARNQIAVHRLPLLSEQRILRSVFKPMTTEESDTIFSMLMSKESNPSSSLGIRNVFLWLYQHVVWAICQNSVMTNAKGLRKYNKVNKSELESLASEVRFLDNVQQPLLRDLNVLLESLPAGHAEVVRSVDSLQSRMIEEHDLNNRDLDLSYEHLWGFARDLPLSPPKIWFSLDLESRDSSQKQRITQIAGVKTADLNPLTPTSLRKINQVVNQLPGRKMQDMDASTRDTSRRPSIHPENAAPDLSEERHIRGVPPVFLFGETPYHQASVGRIMEQDLGRGLERQSNRMKNERRKAHTALKKSKSFVPPRPSDSVLKMVPRLTYWGVFTSATLHPAFFISNIFILAKGN